MKAQVALVARHDPLRTGALLELAREDPEVVLDWIDADLPAEEQVARCRAHEMIILEARMSMQALLSCERLRFIQLMSAGFDAYDINVLNARGIHVANNSAAIAPAVAEHAILLMLALKRRLIENWLSVQRRKWRGLVQEDKMTELTGSTVGLVGLGRIGREVAQRLKGWDVKLLYFDVFPAPDDVEQELGVRRVSLTELLGDADIVSLHVPLCEQTHHLIGERELRMMKPTAMLVNTCRGPVVDQSALCEALKEGHLAGAGLDVFETEPAEVDNPLLDMENVVVTPHVAGTTLERIRRVNAFALENVKRVLHGDAPLSLVHDQATLVE